MIPSTDLRPIPDGCIPIDRSLWIWRPILGTSYPAVVHSVRSEPRRGARINQQMSIPVPAGRADLPTERRRARCFVGLRTSSPSRTVSSKTSTRAAIVF
jgi:hypothetical protein